MPIKYEMLSGIRLVRAKITYLHDSCTFNFINENMSVKLLWSVPYRGDRMITYESVYPIQSKDVAKLIITKVRNNPKTLSVFDRSINGKTLFIGYLEYSDNSPFYLSNRVGTIFYDEYTGTGGDVISMITTADNFDLIREDLSVYGKIVHRQVQEIEAESINGPPRLTEMQEKVLRNAFEMGFFNYPKDVHLKDIAQKIGVSAVSVDQYLREAQRKLIRAYLNG